MKIKKLDFPTILIALLYILVIVSIPIMFINLCKPKKQQIEYPQVMPPLVYVDAKQQVYPLDPEERFFMILTEIGIRALPTRLEFLGSPFIYREAYDTIVFASDKKDVSYIEMEKILNRKSELELIKDSISYEYFKNKIQE